MVEADTQVVTLMFSSYAKKFLEHSL